MRGNDFSQHVTRCPNHHWRWMIDEHVQRSIRLLEYIAEESIYNNIIILL